MARKMHTMNPVQSKLVRSEKVVDGIITNTTEFQYVGESDMRDQLSYKDFCLGNLQAMGQLANLKTVVMQRNDVDMVVDSIEKHYESAQKVAENPQA